MSGAAPRRRRPPGGGVLRGLLAGAALAGALAGGPACAVRRLFGPRLTGTCDGACAHYAACKGHDGGALARCRRECPEVFSDDESLRAFESLACPKAVEYVDGPRATRGARAGDQPSAVGGSGTGSTDPGRASRSP